MKIWLRLLLALVLLSLVFGNTQSHPDQVYSENLLTYREFGKLLVKVMGPRIPAEAELLSDDEYYEVITNILAEKGVNDFLDNAPDSIVTRAGMANVIYGISGATDELSPDEKIDYLIEKGYLPRSYLNSNITFVEGEVLLLKKGAGDWRKVNPGDALESGDTVKTLESSRAKLQLSSGGKVALKESASVKINVMDSNGPEKGGSAELFLSEGEIQASIKRLEEGSTFEVKTPNAVCGMRGTVFYVSVDELFNTGLFVEKNKVNFLNLFSNLFYDVNENKSSFSDNKGNITKPVFVPLNERKRWIGGFEGITNVVPVTFGGVTTILNNPALATLVAEGYSRPESSRFTGDPPGSQGEGPASSI